MTCFIMFMDFIFYAKFVLWKIISFIFWKYKWSMFIPRYSNIHCRGIFFLKLFANCRDCHGRDHMVVGLTTTYAISAYHHLSCEFESRSWRDVLNKTLCDKVCQWLAAGQWFSLSTSVNITEILLTVLLNSITLILTLKLYCIFTVLIS